MDIDIIKICSKKDFLYFLCKLKEDYYTEVISKVFNLGG